MSAEPDTDQPIEYNLLARAERDSFHLSHVIGRPERLNLPSSRFIFLDPSEEAYAVILHWKSTPPLDQRTWTEVEYAAREYAARLRGETTYEGPIDCCL